MNKIFFASIFIMLSISAFPQSAQSGFEVKLQPNEITPIYFIHINHPFYSIQLNCPFTTIPRDPYNKGNDKPAVSLYGLFTLGSVIIIGMGISANSPTQSTVSSILNTAGIGFIAVLIASNCEAHLNLIKLDTSQTNPFKLSIFAGTQTDFFGQNIITWPRIALRSGLEMDLQFLHVDNKDERLRGIKIGLLGGVTRHWDFIAHSKTKGKSFGFWGINFAIPM